MPRVHAPETDAAIQTVNVVATFVVLASIIPVWVAQRLTESGSPSR